MKMIENIEFPTIFTYKIVGDNTKEFKTDVKTLFASGKNLSITETPSKSGKYISYSVTLELETLEKLKFYYEKINVIHGLKFHV